MENFKARDGNAIFLGRAIDDTSRFKVGLDANGKCYLIIYDETETEIIQLNEAQGLRLLGGATTWEDLNFSVDNSQRGVANQPTLVTVGNVIHSSFATNDYVFDGQEIPHKAKTSTTAQWHFHAFIEPGQSVGTTGAEFTLYWEHRKGTTTTTGTVTGTITSAQLTTSSSGGKIDIDMSSPISIEWGGQMTCYFKRTGGNAGRVIVTTYGLHHEVDGTGSDTIASKT
jgi:hypothetical protein